MAFGIYKRGQGKYTRIWTVVGAAAIAALGCYRLYVQLEPIDWGLSRKAGLWIATMSPAGLFAVFGLLIAWLINKPSLADFLIASEGEMKKVNWSSRKEIAVSTFVVIVVVIVLAVLLGVTDISFRLFFSWLMDIGPQGGA
jgi:preprotein translocase subunit SecE